MGVNTRFWSSKELVSECTNHKATAEADESTEADEANENADIEAAGSGVSVSVRVTM